MEFIITNGRRFGDYKEWPDLIQNKNSRSFKKTFDQDKYETIQIHWELSNYVGPAPQRDMEFFSQDVANSTVNNVINIKTISNYLNRIKTIGEYIPIEGDEIRIYQDYLYKVIKDVIRTGIHFNTISLIYKNGSWVDDYYRWEFVETKFILKGIIKI